MNGKEIYESALQYIKEKWRIKIHSALAYGSRIGGYASEHSDYDILIVAEEFREGIRYIYEKFDGNHVSILLVDKDFFEDDVLKAEHGEFVAGRLYTVYTPLINGNYIKEMEIKLKKRTVLEEICFLFYSFRDLTYEFIIPIKYFLFSRLRRRMQAYPPVKYSYFKMFYAEKGVDNLEFALKGLYAALKDLEKDGVVKFIDIDKVKIMVNLDICKAKAPILFHFFKRGIKSYLTHTKSAKVKPSVVLEETISKLRRSIESLRIPTELANPESLLSFEEAFFNNEYADVDNIVKSIFGPRAIVEKIVRKNFFSELYLIYVNVMGKKYVVIRKKFSLLYHIKWFFIQLWLLDIKHFILVSRNRLINEFIMMNFLRGMKNINIPKPLLLSWPDSSLYMEYIDGKRLIDMKLPKDKNKILEVYYELGVVLGYLHSRKIVLGDAKPNNILVKDNKLYIVDLEQAGERNEYTWDIAELIFYSFLWSSPLRKAGLEKICNSFLQGYLVYGDSKWLEEAIKLKYIRPFLPLSPPNNLLKIRSHIKQYLKS